MAALTPQEARALMERALRLTKAEACEVNVNANSGGNIRYARNTVLAYRSPRAPAGSYLSLSAAYAGRL